MPYGFKEVFYKYSTLNKFERTILIGTKRSLKKQAHKLGRVDSVKTLNGIKLWSSVPLDGVVLQSVYRRSLILKRQRR